mmetsp:Transcript_30674/g.47059  ORF Transcript_30674/g.47059 Transcript_30674/m.47059 type:complete len:127 (+) Transcript_30674:2466-2846(+)
MLQAVGLSKDRFDVCLGGREAIDLVINKTTTGSCPYQIILTDLSMPCIDGYKLTKRLRSMLRDTFAIPLEQQPLIAAITGHTESEFFSLAFDSGIDQVYSKPLTSEVVQLLLTESGFNIDLKPALK